MPAEWAFDEMVVPSIDDFLAIYKSFINLPYIAVYLGLGLGAVEAIKTVVKERHPKG